MAKPGTYAAPNKVVTIDSLQPFLYFDFDEVGFSESKQSNKVEQVRGWLQKLTDDVVKYVKLFDYKKGQVRHALRLDTINQISSAHPVGTQLLRSIESFVNLKAKKDRKPNWQPGAIRLTWKSFMVGGAAPKIDPANGEVVVNFDESAARAYTLSMADFKRVLDVSKAGPGMSVDSATWGTLKVHVGNETFPPEIVLAHEFVHASHAILNGAGSGTSYWHFYDDSGKHLIGKESNEELQTVGLIGDQPYSENLIRYEQGLNLRIAYFVPQQPFETDTVWQDRRAQCTAGP